MNEPGEENTVVGKLTFDEAARLSQHLAGVAETGLPLGSGLRALAEETNGRAYKAALRGLAEAVERGTPLDEAVEVEAAGVPPHLRGLIRAGLRSGDLGGLLGRFATVAGIGTDLKRTFWIGMTYPLLAILMAGAMLVLVDVWIIGRFEAIFRDFGIPLPLMTRFLLETSHIFRFVWPILLSLGGGLLLLWLVLGVSLTRGRRNSLFARLPIIGPLWRLTSWAEFCHLLAMLLEARLPLPEALRLAGEGVDDHDVEIACRAMARSVEEGATLSYAMTGMPATPAPAGPFDRLGRPTTPEAPPLGDLLEVGSGLKTVRRVMPEGLPRLLRWAESHESIAEVLHMAGETFQARCQAEANWGGAVVGFLAMILVIWGVFIVVVGLFLPLITLITKLSG